MYIIIDHEMTYTQKRCTFMETLEDVFDFFSSKLERYSDNPEAARDSFDAAEIEIYQVGVELRPQDITQAVIEELVAGWQEESQREDLHKIDLQSYYNSTRGIN